MKFCYSQSTTMLRSSIIPALAARNSGAERSLSIVGLCILYDTLDPEEGSRVGMMFSYDVGCGGGKGSQAYTKQGLHLLTLCNRSLKRKH